MTEENINPPRRRNVWRNTEANQFFSFDTTNEIIGTGTGRITTAVNSLEEARRELIARARNGRNGSGSGQVLDTIGIELESLALTRDRVGQILTKITGGYGNNFKVHRDGSSEINAFLVGLNDGQNIYISAHTEDAHTLCINKYPVNTLGYELISIPMDIQTAEMSLNALLPMLKANGDFVSERCATHIHVGAMKNLSFVKKALKLGLWFDEVFYSLAHMDGERFRGYSNNAIYARPIQNGPFFRSDRSYYQVLNWEKALEVEQYYEFFACYGVNVDNEMPKYHPGRYFSINLYSVPRIGTLEFRHFNQTFNPQMVSAVAKLCQMFVEVSMKADMSDLKYLEPGNVFETHGSNYYINKLHHFLSLASNLDCTYELDSNDLYVLEEIMTRYKGIGIDNKEVLTHCRDFNIDSDYIEFGRMKKSKSKPEPAGNTDIHNIKWQSIIK